MFLAFIAIVTELVKVYFLYKFLKLCSDVKTIKEELKK